MLKLSLKFTIKLQSFALQLGYCILGKIRNPVSWELQMTVSRTWVSIAAGTNMAGVTKRAEREGLWLERGTKTMRL